MTLGLATLVGVASGAVAAGDGGFDPTSLLANGITPTAVVLLVVFGWLRTKGEAERLEKRLAEVEAAHAALVDKLVDDVVPALTRSADATVASTAAVEAMTRRMIGGG